VSPKIAAQVVDVAGIGNGALGFFTPRYAGLLFYEGSTTVSTYLIHRTAGSGRAGVIALAKIAAARL